jgi:hypothetical protein
LIEALNLSLQLFNCDLVHRCLFSIVLG